VLIFACTNLREGKEATTTMAETSRPMHAVLSYLRRLSGTADVGDLTDGQLLERFVREGDATAFETLMHRHGPLVLSVCRSVLRHEQDAEDAFQATFLVLVRRASAIGKRESVSSWLYGVAFRIAVRAKAATVRRKNHEQPGVEMIAAESPAGVHPHEMALPLHEEVNRLPEKYRSPIVLCYLQGKTREEAAQELGWTPGTVKGRLERGRDLLRSRLTRRGLSFSSGGMAVLLSANVASSAVPAVLLEATLTAARGGPLAGSVAALTKGMLQTMFWTKLTTTAGIMLALALAMTGAGVVAYDFLPEPQPRRLRAGPATTPKPPTQATPDQVRQAIEKGIAYLKKTQREGTWEHHFPGGSYEGGLTSLALLGLLEAGVKVDEEIIRKALEYLRRLEPRQTYVVSLQTQVFCRLDPKQDGARIQRNVDRLVNARGIRGSQLLGWTYTLAGGAGGTDNSNTQYAVLALHVASQAGAKVDEKVWREIQDYYLRTQLADGGWLYAPVAQGRSSFSMTCAGVSGLLLAGKHLKAKAKGQEEALTKSLDLLGERFTIDGKVHSFAELAGIRRAGELAGRKVFVDRVRNLEHDWYREGSRILLREQTADGSWRPSGTAEKEAIIATSFALLFLAKDQ
jgi:RNA polymerase sigma factor (sigma-70 family)